MKHYLQKLDSMPELLSGLMIKYYVEIMLLRRWYAIENKTPEVLKSIELSERSVLFTETLFEKLDVVDMVNEIIRLITDENQYDNDVEKVTDNIVNFLNHVEDLTLSFAKKYLYKYVSYTTFYKTGYGSKISVKGEVYNNMFDDTLVVYRYSLSKYGYKKEFEDSAVKELKEYFSNYFDNIIIRKEDTINVLFCIKYSDTEDEESDYIGGEVSRNYSIPKEIIINKLNELVKSDLYEKPKYSYM